MYLFRNLVTKGFSIRNFSSSRTNYSVGFIGLGNMGGPMAKNLIDKGHALIVYDINSASASEAKKHGANVVSSPKEVAAKVNRIITMLPTSQHVRECYCGTNGIFETISSGTLLIDSSTIDPSVSKEIASLAVKKEATYLDAPVSGGVNAAKAGTLTFMVGGSADDFIAAKELLNYVGQNIIHCGAVGHGQSAKICNNMLLAISMIGTSETMNLGLKLGLDPKLLASIINTSTGRCWASDTYNPVPGIMDKVPSSKNYEGGFGTSLMAKDLGLAQDAATQCKVAIPLGSLAHQIYRIMCSTDLASKDFSSVFKFLKEMDK